MNFYMHGLLFNPFGYLISEENLYQQSYVDENAQYNNQLYCGEDYYNSNQMHCNYYQETHQYNECTYDYTPYDANTAYNNNFQNSNLNYDYSNTQMYDYQNYSNHTNNQAEYNQNTGVDSRFYYNADPYQQDTLALSQKHMVDQGYEAETYLWQDNKISM